RTERGHGLRRADSRRNEGITPGNAEKRWRSRLRPSRPRPCLRLRLCPRPCPCPCPCPRPCPCPCPCPRLRFPSSRLSRTPALSRPGRERHRRHPGRSRARLRRPELPKTSSRAARCRFRAGIVDFPEKKRGGSGEEPKRVVRRDREGAGDLR